MRRRNPLTGIEKVLTGLEEECVDRSSGESADWSGESVDWSRESANWIGAEVVRRCRQNRITKTRKRYEKISTGSNFVATKTYMKST